MSGFAQLTGQPDGPPTLPPFGLADAFCAMYSVGAVMFALYWRDVNNGTGQYIDSTILEPIFVALMHPHIIEYSETGTVRKRLGNRSNNVAPRNTYETKDGEWVAVSSSSESIAKRILEIVGGEELRDDPRFETMQSRIEHVEELDEIVQDWMQQHTRTEIIEIFEENEAAIAPIYDIEDIFNDPHFQSRDAIVEVADEELGDVSMHGIVPKLSETPGTIDHTGPALGEHTEEILTNYTSISREKIEELTNKGILATTE
jgi:formyl-CoA transferase